MTATRALRLRGDVERGIVDSSASCTGSCVIWMLQLFTRRAVQAIGEFEQALALDRNLATAPRDDRIYESLYWSRRGKRGSHPASVPAFSPRQQCVPVDALAWRRQIDPRRRRGGGQLAAPVS